MESWLETGRLSVRSVVPAALVAVALFGGAAGAASPPLSLASMGVFYVGGVRVESPYADDRAAKLPNKGYSTVLHQAKVTFLLPERVTSPAIILVPGFGLSSSIYLSTPDGREGWAQNFARRGHPVYVVDIPDRGTSGMAVDAVNGCIARDPAYPCSPDIMLGRTSLENPWRIWGFGPRFGERHATSRFPAFPLQENYIEQFGASFEVFSGSGSMGASGPTTATVSALQRLLERVGPAVLVLHSAAGGPGFNLASARGDLVKAVVAVETTPCPVGGPDGRNALGKVPLLGIYGDFVNERVGGEHPARHASCKRAAESLARSGVSARFIDLPQDLKIAGNSHLMMMDDNSAEIAEVIDNWLMEAGIRR